VSLLAGVPNLIFVEMFQTVGPYKFTVQIEGPETKRQFLQVKQTVIPKLPKLKLPELSLDGLSGLGGMFEKPKAPNTDPEKMWNMVYYKAGMNDRILKNELESERVNVIDFNYIDPTKFFDKSVHGETFSVRINATGYFEVPQSGMYRLYMGS
jgi:hypothetical protein